MAAQTEVNRKTRTLYNKLLALREEFRGIFSRDLQIITRDKRLDLYNELSSIQQGLDTIPNTITTVEVLETRKNLAIRIGTLLEELQYYRYMYYLINQNSAETC
jgi:hypothetical protein